ncbi:hypothetical protein OC845_004391 [Tilletia horrida]|nr:hypothetical protein OC845_004391 [Tilletia horrida]
MPGLPQPQLSPHGKSLPVPPPVPSSRPPGPAAQALHTASKPNAVNAIPNHGTNGSSSSSNGAAQSPSQPQAKVKASPKPTHEPYFCHKHKGGNCTGPPFQCTYLRPSGKRCGFRFCPKALKEIGVDPVMLLKVGLNDLSVEAEEHTSLAKQYFFQCPRCKGSCDCETCLESSSSTPKSTSTSAAGAAKGWGNFMQESRGNQKKKQTGAAKSKSSTSKKATTANAKAAGGAAGAAAPKGKKKAAAAGSDSKDGKAAPKAKANGKATKEKAGSAANKATGKATPGPAKKAKGLNGQPIKKVRPDIPPMPDFVPPPKLQVIDTKLPIPNIEARIYLYETLVRLTDIVKVPKTTLGTLDRFDAWGTRQCQQLLERLLAAAAGLSYIDRGQPSKHATSAIKAYREFGSQLHRGEPWQAARSLVRTSLGHDVDELPAVDRTAEEEREREEEDRLAVLAAAAELPAVRVTRRMAAAEQRLIQRSENGGGSGSDTDRGSRARIPSGSRGASSRLASGSTSRSSNGRKNGGGASSSRLAYRRDLLGDSDDDNDTSDDDSDNLSSRSSSLRRGRATSGKKKVEHDNDDANMSDAESVSSKSESGQSAYVASDEEDGRRRSHRRGSDDTPIAANSPSDSLQPGIKVVEPPKEAEPVPPPHLEAKVAILCGLCDVVLQTSDAAKEIKAGIDGVAAAEKEHRVTIAQLEKDWGTARDALNAQAPSMAAETYAAWKQKRADAEREHKWILIQENVKHALQLDTLKIRTGPIGTDLDGRVYWQLSEYIEKMPSQTGGRWAWCLLVEGPPFPTPGDQHLSNGHAQPKKSDDAASPSASDLSSLSASSASSGLSSIPPRDDDEELAKRPFGGFDEEGRPRNNFEVSIPVIRKKTDGTGGSASSVASTSSSLSSISTGSKTGEVQNGIANGVGAIGLANQPGAVFMGTNYPSEIKQIISYLRYRCAYSQYSDIMQQVKRPEVFTQAEVDAQREKHAKLKAQTEDLVKALSKVRDYYIWHLEEVTSIE